MGGGASSQGIEEEDVQWLTQVLPRARSRPLAVPPPLSELILPMRVRLTSRTWSQPLGRRERAAWPGVHTAERSMPCIFRRPR